MNKSEFLIQIEEILEIDEKTLTGTETLSDFENWDSLAFLSVIAIADEQFNIVLEGEALQNVVIVNDLVNLVESQLN
jgi:acyl carrier protein